VKSGLLYNPIQVVRKHPKYPFEKEELVVVVANNKDLFWIAKVTNSNDEKVAFSYYDYMINWNAEEIYKLHISTRSCRLADIISYFSTKD
jgi:hypothetical protein